MIRVVLDANVIVSAILNPSGTPAAVFRALKKDESFLLLISDAILVELERVLLYPKLQKIHRKTPAQVKELIEELGELAVWTPGQVVLEVVEEDPSDNRYLECAVEGEAHFLVSGDRHLLSLKSFQDIQIVDPSSFIAALELGTL